MSVDYEVRELARDMYQRICERAERIAKDEPDFEVPGSHLLAPWVPGRQDLREVVLSSNGHKR